MKKKFFWKHLFVLLFIGFISTKSIAQCRLLNETFNVNPVLSSTNVDGTWYPDRYRPAGFASAVLAGNNVLKISIDGVNDGIISRTPAYNSSFYNTQGRKFNQCGKCVTVLKGNLYIPADWASKKRRSDMWATGYDAFNAISFYPIIGFRNVDGLSPSISYWNGTSWVNSGVSLTYDSWYSLESRLIGANIEYYVDNVLVGSIGANSSTYFGDIIMNTYNFNDPSLGVSYDPNPATNSYDAYWDNLVTTGNGGNVVTNTTQNIKHCSIQSAIDAAANGDEIVVGDGTYTESVIISGKNVKLYSQNGAGSTTIQSPASPTNLGAVRLAGTTTGNEIGKTGQGFTIIGVDNADPAIEFAAIYINGSHTDAAIEGNIVTADGEHGLLSEFGSTLTNLVVNNNTFNGKTFVGAIAAGIGFGAQFTLHNVPRQLVTLGCGNNCATSSVVFTNNTVSGVSGSATSTTSPFGPQGNNLVSIDVLTLTATGNNFIGTTYRFATAFRARGNGAQIITGNTFAASNPAHYFGKVAGNVFANNSFPNGAALVQGGSDIDVNINNAYLRSPASGTVLVAPGTYPETLTIGKSITILGPNAAINPNVDGNASTVNPSRVAEAIIEPVTISGAMILSGANALNVVIKGFTIDRDNGTANDARFMDLINRTGNAWTFENNIFQNAPATINGYFYLTGTTTGMNFTFNQNRFTGNGNSNGLAFWGSNPTMVSVTNNVWYNNMGWAINSNSIQGTISGNSFVEDRISAADIPNFSNYQNGVLFANIDNNISLTANVFKKVHIGMYLYRHSPFSGIVNATENIFDQAFMNGVRVLPGASNPDLTNVSVNNNAFLSGSNIEATGQTMTLNATCNWYGTTNNAVIASRISGPVTYMPYLTNGTDNSAATGFQPVSGSCNGSNFLTITCPPNISVQCASAVPALDVSSVTKASGTCPSFVVTHLSDVISNQTCANRYTITRTYQATDACGNIATCIQTITVNDQTPPTINCPSNITVSPTTLAGTVVTYTLPTVTENCSGGALVRTAGLASGSTFPIGTTTVTHRVTDACGLTASCSFTVTVINPYCDNKKKKAYVCHSGTTLCVSIGDVQTHLNHGDYLGRCAGNSQVIETEEASIQKGSVGSLPKDYKLSNYPNPFLVGTSILMELPEESKISLRILDVTGREVANLLKESRKGGTYTIDFNASKLGSGIYYAILEATANGKVIIKSVKLVKQ